MGFGHFTCVSVRLAENEIVKMLKISWKICLIKSWRGNVTSSLMCLNLLSQFMAFLCGDVWMEYQSNL